jgi:hypothetical protein
MSWEGFRITGRRGRQWDVRRVPRRVGQVWVPKAGWVRFRWSRTVNADVNAAISIAAGHPTHLPIPPHSRRGDGVTRPVNCEPQLLLQSA